MYDKGSQLLNRISLYSFLQETFKHAGSIPAISTNRNFRRFGKGLPRPRFERRRNLYFASQNALQEKEVLPLPQPTRVRATIRNSLISFAYF